MPGAIQIVGTMMNYCVSLPSIEPSFGKSDKACTSMQVLTSWNFSSIWPHSIEEKFVGSTPGSAGESATCEEVSHTFTDPAGFYGHAILQHMPGREPVIQWFWSRVKEKEIERPKSFVLKKESLIGSF